MKKITCLVYLVLFFASTTTAFSQAYKGKGDVKGQIGLSLQDGGTGIALITDFGVSENLSFGVLAGYMLNVDDDLGFKPRFEDRADLRIRINANLGNVFKFDEHIDLYPGLNLGLRNFGGHLGFRYFFTDGFGLFTEVSAPLARYDNDVRGYEKYNNQFVFLIGTSFNF